MKNVKKRLWKRLIVFMTLLCVMVSQVTMYSYAAESEESVVNYVALGDSITAGNDSYVSQVSDYLKKSYGECVTNNMGVSGMTSAALLDCLTNPSNSYYNNMRNAIKNADIITLDIGSNDIFGTAAEVVAECFGTTSDNLGTVMESWEKRIQNAKGFQLFLLYMEAMSIARNINSELNYGEAMPEALNTYEINYKKIVSIIKQLAPNAKVYIGNLYNPYVDAADFYCGSFEVLNMEEFSRTNILKANAIIANNANGNVVVDLYNTINDPMYIKGDVVNGDYDPHPNATGHKAIAAKFIAAIASGQ